MRSKIRVLPDHVINKIAAGEVIANPSSVVKELVENSLDAGATDIVVEIKSGGRSLIRISDNGCGMSADDALLCLERHGTSKMRDIEDLHSLNTMGFRGEAIPSIASISKFTLITSDGKESTMVLVEGGKILHCSSAVRSPGTTIEVKSLFFNVPVRKKFLKSPAYDSQEILKNLSALALANPRVKFQLIDDNKEILAAPTSLDEGGNERISAILGEDFLSASYPFSFEEGGYKLYGRIGLPSYSRQNRTGQYLFVNHRSIQSPLISYAIREGYGTTLPTKRHPVYVLYLEMSGDLVDVNVHPQKREIRLREENRLKQIIIQTIAAALRGKEAPINPPLFVHSNNERFSIHPVFEREIPSTYQFEQRVEEPLNIKESPNMASFFIDEVPTYHVLATIQGYFFAEKENQLYLIDQKRAHHRILFDKMLKTDKNQAEEIEQFLIPHTLECTKSEANLLRLNLPALQQMGLGIREFGENSFLIDSVPKSLNAINISHFIQEVIQDLTEFETSNKLKNEQEKRLMALTDRAAVGANKRLSLIEANSLLNQLMNCQYPYQCPRGKPTMVKLSQEEIAKQFDF